MNIRACPPPAYHRNLAGEVLRRFRRADGLSQMELVAKLQRKGWDMDRAVLVRLESGQRTLLDYEIDFILRVLGRKWEDLAGGLQERRASVVERKPESGH